MSLPTVIIPSRNAANLVACLGALRKHEPDCPVIVVDDGLEWPSDVDWPIDGVTLFEGVKPFVFARNCNIGIRAAGDSDVVLCNDDALLESPGGFQLLQRAALSRPDIGIIGATTNVTGQPLQYRFGKVRCRDCEDRAPFVECDEPGIWHGTSLGPHRCYFWDSLRIVPHIAFVCVYLPRRTIRDLGARATYTAHSLGVYDGRFTDGLDERYCLDYGCDDADYCEQVTRAGLKVAVHDGCYVDHGSLTSTYRGDPRAAKSFAQNYKLLMEKWEKLESQLK